MADRKGSVASRATTNAANPPTAAVSTSSPAETTTAYGTRSKARGPRINYAEDKDNEMDFEFTPPYNPTSNTSKTNGESSSSGTSRRQPTAGAASGKDSNHGKDSALAVPAASSSTVSGKKRKSAALQQDIPPMVKDASLSNMYSFDKPYLNDRKLIADDGTVFAIHGM
jgi:hypothetical protein